MTEAIPQRAGRFRLGTRGSPLAIAQARMVSDALQAVHGWDNVEIVTFRTSGDRVTDRPLAELGGKALWTRELDQALLDGNVDACVHSIKDIETLRPDEIVLAAMLPRADVRERLVGSPSIAALPPRALIGTSSPRRAAQLCHARPDLQVTAIRGNVATRLAKVECGEMDATLLAAAGLERLGHANVGATIPVGLMLPAAGQGAVGIETLSDGGARTLVAAIDHPPTSVCVRIERSFLAYLGAGCHSPVAALATMVGDEITLRAELLSKDGAHRIAGKVVGHAATICPQDLASDLLSRAPDAVLAHFALNGRGFVVCLRRDGQRLDR